MWFNTSTEQRDKYRTVIDDCSRALNTFQKSNTFQNFDNQHPAVKRSLEEAISASEQGEYRSRKSVFCSRPITGSKRVESRLSGLPQRVNLQTKKMGSIKVRLVHPIYAFQRGPQ